MEIRCKTVGSSKFPLQASGDLSYLSHSRPDVLGQHFFSAYLPWSFRACFHDQTWSARGSLPQFASVRAVQASVVITYGNSTGTFHQRTSFCFEQSIRDFRVGRCGLVRCSAANKRAALCLKQPLRCPGCGRSTRTSCGIFAPSFVTAFAAAPSDRLQLAFPAGHRQRAHS
jgi:hypothetical protein